MPILRKEAETDAPQADPNWPRDVEARLNRLQKASMDIKVVLGRTRLSLAELNALEDGSVVETNTLSGMPIDILVNNTLFARGEIVVVGDNMAVRVTDLVKPEAMVNG